MNAHVTFPSDRILLPRGLVGRPVPATDYRYSPGEVVSWGDEYWLVMSRETSMMGRHLYKVYKESDERPVRHVDGNVLLPAVF